MLLRYAILGLLDGQELHGYRIKSVFEEQVGSSWPLNFGQIYQTLKDLRRRGLIEGRFDRGTGHVGRWMYTITAKGRAPRRPQSIRDEILIRLLVLDRKEVDTRLGQLASQEQVYRDYVGQLAAERKVHQAGANGGGLLKALAADAAIYQAEAHLRWLAHSTKLLKRNVGAQALPARKAANGNGGAEPLFDAPKLKAAAR
jgi:DNA-binding PadR family transcriptional regulator